jgi:hypothetical protein
MNVPQGGLVCRGCASTCGILTATSGSFSDGSESSNYSHNSSCGWVIAPKTGATSITITFTEFNTELSADVVAVYLCVNVSCQGAQLVRELSGSYSSYQTITVSAGYALVRFTSDASTNDSGFAASWTSDTLRPLSKVRPDPLCVCNQKR